VILGTLFHFFVHHQFENKKHITKKDNKIHTPHQALPETNEPLPMYNPSPSLSQPTSSLLAASKG
jgi:hypothetical protein